MTVLSVTCNWPWTEANISAHLHLSATVVYDTPAFSANIPNWKNSLSCLRNCLLYFKAHKKARNTCGPHSGDYKVYRLMRCDTV